VFPPISPFVIFYREDTKKKATSQNLETITFENEKNFSSDLIVENVGDSDEEDRNDPNDIRPIVDKFNLYKREREYFENLIMFLTSPIVKFIYYKVFASIFISISV
jgi:hypothetical protein